MATPPYPAPLPLANEARRTFVSEFFAVQLRLLHGKLRDPAALPAGAPGDSNVLRRTDRLARHWTMLSMVFQNATHTPTHLDNPAWAARIGVLQALFARYPGPSDGEAFETRALDALIELLDAGWKAYERSDAERPWFGCFRGEVDPATRCLSLHVRNAVRPRSPFEDPAGRQAELRAICLEAERSGEPPREVRCASWLNSLPAFQALFPQAYAESLKPEGPFPAGLGWWGQLIGRDGTLHRRRAEALRQTGHFEYPRLAGLCPFRVFRESLGLGQR